MHFISTFKLTHYTNCILFLNLNKFNKSICYVYYNYAINHNKNIFNKIKLYIKKYFKITFKQIFFF